MSAGSSRDQRPRAPAAVSLPHSTVSVREARRKVLLGLRRLGVVPELIDDAVLVASELVTNALRHARPLPDGRLVLSWEAAPDGRAIRLAVYDGGSEASQPAAPDGFDTQATSGRGLGIVATLSQRWGADSGDEGTVVWAVLVARSRPDVPRSGAVEEASGAAGVGHRWGSGRREGGRRQFGRSQPRGPRDLVPAG
jgi:anti-sigma regulatory factor (Ser/Thr protein kinase)